MKLMITGGAGFIGSNFIRYILREHPDWAVVNLDKLTYAGNLENLRDIENSSRYAFVRGDIADGALVDRLFSDHVFDAVVNFAAESHVDRSIMDAAPFIDTNIKGTQVLLNAALSHGTGRYLQVSTDEVYGSLGPEDPAFAEDSPIAPNSPYAASKAAADLMVRAYVKTHGLPAVITRCSNNYGPYQFPEKLIPLMITNALEDKPLPIYGDGMNVRDWIHVEDHCRAIEQALIKGKDGEVYNIGADCGMTNIEVVTAILKAVGKPDSLITYVKDRPGHDRRYAMNAEKIKRELGWEPKYRLSDVVTDIVNWYIENEKWWRRIKSGEYLHYYEMMYGGREIQPMMGSVKHE